MTEPTRTDERGSGQRPATMRAIVRDRYGPPDILRVETVPKPTPGDGEVLVRVRAASLNTADLDTVRGYPFALRLFGGILRPRTRRIGLDLAGTVEAIGPGVGRLAPGDAVWADLSASRAGSFAEYVCVRELAVHPMPPGLPFDQASALPHSGLLALQALAAGRIEAGDSVLINGAGGCVGPFAVQIARLAGAEVTGVDHPDKLEFVRSLGTDHVLDFTKEDITRRPERHDVVLDIAARRWFGSFRRVLTPDGRYVLIARTLTQYAAVLVAGAMTRMGGRRMGTFVWAPDRRDDLDRLAGMVGSGELEVRIDRCYPLEGVPDALGYLAGGHARGKLVILP